MLSRAPSSACHIQVGLKVNYFNHVPQLLAQFQKGMWVPVQNYFSSLSHLRLVTVNYEQDTDCS